MIISIRAYISHIGVHRHVVGLTEAIAQKDVSTGGAGLYTHAAAAAISGNTASIPCRVPAVARHCRQLAIILKSGDYFFQKAGKKCYKKL